MSQGIENPDPATHGQQVLVLQGGGALGACQVGVYQALDQFGIDLDWVVGTRSAPDRATKSSMQ